MNRICVAFWDAPAIAFQKLARARTYRYSATPVAGTSTYLLIGLKVAAKAGRQLATLYVTTAEVYDVTQALQGLGDGKWEWRDFFNILALLPYVPIPAQWRSTAGEIADTIANMQAAVKAGDQVPVPVGVPASTADDLMRAAQRTEVFARSGGGIGPQHMLPSADAIAPGGPYRGGRHSETKLPKGDGFDSNHMPADAISPIPREDGPAIQMEPADHRRMSSTGNSREAREWRRRQKDLIEQGRFNEAQQMDIDEVRDLFGDRYEEAVQEMLEYSRTLKTP